MRAGEGALPMAGMAGLGGDRILSQINSLQLDKPSALLHSVGLGGSCGELLESLWNSTLLSRQVYL